MNCFGIKLKGESRNNSLIEGGQGGVVASSRGGVNRILHSRVQAFSSVHDLSNTPISRASRNPKSKSARKDPAAAGQRTRKEVFFASLCGFVPLLRDESLCSFCNDSPFEREA